MTNLAWLGPVFAALIAGGFAFWGVVRRASGRIATTEAADLWKEANSLRDVYRSEIERLNAKILEIDQRLSVLEQENTVLRDQNRVLEQRNEDLHKENLRLEREVQRLTARVDELERANA